MPSSTAMAQRSARASLVLPLLLLLLSTPLVATTFVMPTDLELLDKSELVVVGKVVAADLGPGDQGLGDRPTTDYSVEVSALLKGFLPGTTIVVRELGGLSADGQARMMVFGAAPLVVGEEFVLFLEEHDGGTFRVMDLTLGAFWKVPGEDLAVRTLAGTSELRRPNDPQRAERRRSHLPRRFGAFVEWLGATADAPNGSSAIARNYFVEQNASLVGVSSAFNLTRSPAGNPPGGCSLNAGSPVRWQEFDTNDEVLVFANEMGQPGVAGGGFSQIQQAIALWKGVSGTQTNLVYGGTTSATAAISGTDFLTSIAFEDPNDEVAGSYPSAQSGAVAVSLVFFRCEVVHQFFGGVAHTLLEAGVVTQDGTGSFFFDPINFLEVMAHEVGHIMGIAHACGDPATGPCSGLQAEALMRAFPHDDGRGAQLNNDDRDALRALYTTPAANGPAAPTALSATPSSTSTIELAWVDNANNETGFSIEQRNPPSQVFSFIGNVAADVTSATITGLAPETTVEFRVRGQRNGSFSAYSNTASATTFSIPGPCVANDNTLCLTNDRFQVTIDYATTQNTSGAGRADEITEDTGYFTFFEEANVEVVVKVLDACSFSNRFWVFAGGLTNVNTTLQVVDTQTGATKTYTNPKNSHFNRCRTTTPLLPVLEALSTAKLGRFCPGNRSFSRSISLVGGVVSY